MKTTRLALLAIAVAAILSVAASAQLTLDNFPTGNSGKNYVKSLTTAQSSATHYEGLPSGSLLGAARETTFAIGPNPYSQTSTIDVGNGILIVDTGFQVPSALEIFYGTTTKGVETPLGLNLGAYSGLQLNFAGVISTEGIDVVVEVWPSSGGYYALGQEVATNGSSFTVGFPFTGFTGAGGTLTQAETTDISYIVIVIEGSGDPDITDSFAITSLQAY